jgi:hypothetical protein
VLLFRSTFWLTSVVLALPPVDGEHPAPRVGLLETVQAARILAQDVFEICERNRSPCATSRDAFVLVQRKIETCAEIVSTGLAQRGRAGAASSPDHPHGTLTAADLAPDWAAPGDR